MMKKVTGILLLSFMVVPLKQDAFAAPAAPKSKSALKALSPVAVPASRSSVSHNAPARNTAPQAANKDQSAALRPYCSRLWSKIANKWYLADGNNHVTLTAVVDGGGNVESVNLASSPKCAEAENSAQNAFEAVKPLESLPSGISKAKVVVSFNSKVDPHGDSSSNGSIKIEALQAGSGAASGGDSSGGDASASEPAAK